MVKKFTLTDFGYEVQLGKFARQADGAVWFQQGGTVILATVVSAPSPDFPGFLPLTIDYREQFAAAGKIPGGYYKREGRFTDKEILTARLIDRAVRPLFPETYFNQLQVLVTVYSVDKEHSPHIISLIATSLAISISKIPFLGPVGAIEVARIKGEWIFNPTYTQSLESDVKLIIAGTEEGICMVEGCTNEITEDEFLDVLFKAHDNIKKQVLWQQEIQREVGIPKELIDENIDWKAWTNYAEAFLTKEKINSLFISDKIERS